MCLLVLTLRLRMIEEAPLIMTAQYNIKIAKQFARMGCVIHRAYKLT